MIGQYRYAIVVVIIIAMLIIFMYTIYNPHVDAWEKYMYGYWVGDSVFCEQSEIDTLLLFIGENENNVRNGYLVIGGDVADMPIKIKYNKLNAFDPSRAKISKKLTTLRMPVEIEFTDEIEIPSLLTMELDIISGTLRLFDQKTIYGVWRKDHEITAMFTKE